MMTINSLCLFSITEFLDDMFELKTKYGYNKPVVDLNILRWPAFMSPLTLPDEFKKQLHEKLITTLLKFLIQLLPSVSYVFLNGNPKSVLITKKSKYHRG